MLEPRLRKNAAKELHAFENGSGLDRESAVQGPAKPLQDHKADLYLKAKSQPTARLAAV